MRVLYRMGDASPERNLSHEKSPIEIAIIQNDHLLVRELLNWKELQGSLNEVLKPINEGKNIFHM